MANKYMTPEEYRKMGLSIQNVIRNSNAPAGGQMMSQSVMTPEQIAAMSADFSGQERQIASQRAYADKLRGRPSPEGRTVGPSNIYVGPNWAESLRGAAGSLLGGYMAGKANKDDVKLDKDRTALKKAILQGEMEEKNRALALEQANRAEDRANEVEDRDLGAESDRLDGREAGTYALPDGGSVRGYVEHGITYREDGTPMPSGATLTPKIARGSGSRFNSSVKTDEYGNEVSRVFDKTIGAWGEPTFIDGEPYSEEAAMKRANSAAGQAGNIAGAKAKATTLLEQYGEAGQGLMAANQAVGQFKIAKQALKEGANSGPIVSKMPGVWTDATTKLYNARDSQALTQIAAYTFGSLSEAEGDWLKDTSIPVNMNEENLGKWLDKKIDGFERAAASERYRLDEIEAGRLPNPQVMEEIKYGGGFTWE